MVHFEFQKYRDEWDKVRAGVYKQTFLQLRKVDRERLFTSPWCECCAAMRGANFAWYATAIPNPASYPDYCDVIKEPMCWTMISESLSKPQRPSEFAVRGTCRHGSSCLLLTSVAIPAAQAELDPQERAQILPQGQTQPVVRVSNLWRVCRVLFGTSRVPCAVTCSPKNSRPIRATRSRL